MGRAIQKAGNDEVAQDVLPRREENCEGSFGRTERASRLPQREETRTQSRKAESRITPARTKEQQARKSDLGKGCGKWRMQERGREEEGGGEERIRGRRRVEGEARKQSWLRAKQKQTEPQARGACLLGQNARNKQKRRPRVSRAERSSSSNNGEKPRHRRTSSRSSNSKQAISNRTVQADNQAGRATFGALGALGHFQSVSTGHSGGHAQMKQSHSPRSVALRQGRSRERRASDLVSMPGQSAPTVGRCRVEGRACAACGLCFMILLGSASYGNGTDDCDWDWNGIGNDGVGCVLFAGLDHRLLLVAGGMGWDGNGHDVRKNPKTPPPKREALEETSGVGHPRPKRTNDAHRSWWCAAANWLAHDTQGFDDLTAAPSSALRAPKSQEPRESSPPNPPLLPPVSPPGLTMRLLGGMGGIQASADLRGLKSLTRFAPPPHWLIARPSSPPRLVFFLPACAASSPEAGIDQAATCF